MRVSMCEEPNIFDMTGRQMRNKELWKQRKRTPVFLFFFTKTKKMTSIEYLKLIFNFDFSVIRYLVILMIRLKNPFFNSEGISRKDGARKIKTRSQTFLDVTMFSFLMQGKFGQPGVQILNFSERPGNA